MVDLKNLETETGYEKWRRVPKFILIYCTEGAVDLGIDEKKFCLLPGEVITITSGQVHMIHPGSGKGFILEFTLDFFCKDDADIQLVFHNGLFCHFALNEVIAVDRTVLEGELMQIRAELAQQPYQYLISVHSRIKLILVAINRAKVSRGDDIWKPDALFLRFLETVRTNFEHNYNVSQLARLLGTTELKLNELSRLHTGKTAQNVIYGLITHFIFPTSSKSRLAFLLKITGSSMHSKNYMLFSAFSIL
jgi:AraC family transcriptional regulator, transcriptional activator of pobA